jgi:hypothetical protein
VLSAKGTTTSQQKKGTFWEVALSGTKRNTHEWLMSYSTGLMQGNSRMDLFEMVGGVIYYTFDMNNALGARLLWESPTCPGLKVTSHSPSGAGK